MSQDTDVLLRTILYQVLKAKSIKEVEHAILAMCNKDLIAAVKEEVAKSEEEC